MIKRLIDFSYIYNVYSTIIILFSNGKEVHYEMKWLGKIHASWLENTRLHFLVGETAEYVNSSTEASL